MVEIENGKQYLDLTGLRHLVGQIKDRYDGSLNALNGFSIETEDNKGTKGTFLKLTYANGTTEYIDANIFVKDGMLSSVSIYVAKDNEEIPPYNEVAAGDKFLKFEWNTDAGDPDPDNPDVNNITYIKVSDLGINDNVLNDIAAAKSDAAIAKSDAAAAKSDAATATTVADAATTAADAATTAADAAAAKADAATTAANTATTKADAATDTANAAMAAIDAWVRIDEEEITAAFSSTTTTA